MMRAWVAIFAVIGAVAQARELDVPDVAQLAATRSSDLDTYEVPVKPFLDGTVPVYIMEGPVVREAWRLNGISSTTLQLLKPLRDQLLDTGYTVQLDCADATCGGFDFRFGIEVLPAPNMVVNLRDYHFVSAFRGPTAAPHSAITILVSRTDTAGFIQIIRAGTPKPVSAKAAELEPRGVEITSPVVIGDMTEALTTAGHVILHDLEFESGSSRLGEGPFKTLENLARFLKAYPDARVALVGHTDAVGSLSGNIALSKARAQAVAQALIQTYDIPEGQLDAEGMGYLSPIATNLVQAGRVANRRVEVVLLSVDPEE